MKTAWKVVIPVLLVVLLFAALHDPPVRRASAQSIGQSTLASGWNVSTVSSGSAVFNTDLVPSRPTSVIRIGVVLGSSAPLSIRETDGTHTFTSTLNGGTNLTAGACYTFVWECRCASASGGVAGGPTGINFVVGSGTTVPILRVTEVSGAVD